MSRKDNVDETGYDFFSSRIDDKVIESNEMRAAVPAERSILWKHNISRVRLIKEKSSSFSSSIKDSSTELKYKGPEHQIVDFLTRINDSLDTDQECFYVLNSTRHLAGPQSMLIIVICPSLL